MDERHCRTNCRQQQGVLNRCIATTNDANVMASKQFSLARSGFYHPLTGKLFLTRHAYLARPHACGDDDRDRLKLFTTRQQNPPRPQIHGADAGLRPEIELSSVNIRREALEQFLAVASFKSEIVIDRIVDAVKLPADLFGLLEHKRVESQLVAPESG